MLDGQQRATSIIKGFHDIWSNATNDRKINSALWVDLAPKDMKKTDRRFLFRLVTRSHPWGYRKNNPSERLSAAAARSALSAFRKLSGNQQRKPHDFYLHEVFTWDTEAPVPLALLLKAIIRKGDDPKQVAKELKEQLENVSFWQNWKNLGDSQKDIKHFIQLEKELANPSKQFEELVKGLHYALVNFRIPAPILELNNGNTPNPDSNQTEGNTENTGEKDVTDEYHLTFNLFKRINSGGTEPSPEEIQYSLLKSVWSSAPSIIEEEILGERKLCQPARMVSLMVRLYLMVEGKTPDGKKSRVEGLQPALSISQFQTLLKKQRGNFESFCKGKGKKFVEQSWNFLTANEYGLPKILAARIAESHPDLMLLLLYWISKVDFNKLSDAQRCRSLGFVTALAWFAQDERKCVQRLAKEAKEMDESNAKDFFRTYPNNPAW